MQKMLPKAAGVYLFKNSAQRIIYIGKAKNIHKRVNSYFQKQKVDWKVQALLCEYVDIDYILTKNETEALLLEAQLIRDHKPKFNVLLKEGQPFVYLLFTKPTGSSLPKVELVRNKKKKGRYFGPFLHRQQARGVVRYLKQTFKLNLCNKKMENGCLDLHIGICAGNCKKDFDRESYLFRLQLAQDALGRNRKRLIKSIENEIKRHNKKLEFEKAMHLQEYLENIDVILRVLESKFSESKYLHEIEKKTTPKKIQSIDQNDLSVELQEFFGLKAPVTKIDCFDISHFQSNFLVGSCIRFTNGEPDKNSFRRFKIRTLSVQNDYAALQEVVSRRYKQYLQGGDIEDIPDLILIDGGKGQLNAVKKVISGISCVSLAKREETIFGLCFPNGKKLSVKEPVGRLLISLRDYAHHFAISYHRNRRGFTKNLP